jgi:predicted RND superfamily exporter protein
VVVNSSLVLVDYINGEVAAGHSLEEAVANAGVARFRPIFLTSMTTFIGLVPLMATPTPATFFIVPMAISLAFGVLFATVITLFLVPSLYMILYDFATPSRTRGRSQPHACRHPLTEDAVVSEQPAPRHTLALFSPRSVLCSDRLACKASPAPATVTQ